MLHVRAIPVWCLVGVAVLIVLSINYASPRPLSQYSSELFTSYAPYRASEKTKHIINSTLGFERVLAVGLAERSDKRDALSLASSLTGFKVDWIDGVRGESVPDKALPFGVDRVKLWENNVGSWRGHMNAVRKIVEEGYSSALIMEDDMDWDVRLKEQLMEFAKGAKYLQSPTRSHASSPYGDDWDILWLGHCGEVFPEDLDEYKKLPESDPTLLALSRKYTIAPDETVPPPQHAKGFQNFSENPYTRWVHPTGGPICTFAYALSQSGARKVLFDLSVDHLVGPFDNALAGLCRWGRDPGRLGMRCISVTPPLFMHHRAKGYVFSDSDIQKAGGDGKGEVRENGSTENIVWSTRGNIVNMIMGRKMESQFQE